jgi:hypothetical protein
VCSNGIGWQNRGLHGNLHGSVNKRLAKDFCLGLLLMIYNLERHLSLIMLEGLLAWREMPHSDVWSTRSYVYHIAAANVIKLSRVSFGRSRKNNTLWLPI